jgi:DNA-binding transcriptional regulator LsrR (DeoR family)
MNSKQQTLIYKILKDYYEKRKTQQFIADKYGLSRIMVSRLITKAINEKMVEFIIHEPEDPFAKLEREIEIKYELKEVLITPTFKDNQRTVEELGRAGANYMLRSLKGNESVSVSWGHTLLALVNALPKSNFPDINIIQMIGGLGYPEEQLSGNELVRRMANAFNAVPKLLNSPGIVSSKEISEALRNDPQNASTLSLARKADMALVGIGRFSRESLLQKPNSILTPDDVEALETKGAVGDISLQFINENGELIEDDINERIIGISLNDLKKIPRVIGISGGKDKCITVKAALKGKVIDVLITDKETADRLMQ